MASEIEAKQSVEQNECEAAAYITVPRHDHSVICVERLWQLQGWTNIETACDECLY
ncbi:hypothetical protein D3C77_421520 [compost metagenome]